MGGCQHNQQAHTYMFNTIHPSDKEEKERVRVGVRATTEEHPLGERHESKELGTNKCTLPPHEKSWTPCMCTRNAHPQSYEQSYKQPAAHNCPLLTYKTHKHTSASWHCVCHTNMRKQRHTTTEHDSTCSHFPAQIQVLCTVYVKAVNT